MYILLMLLLVIFSETNNLKTRYTDICHIFTHQLQVECMTGKVLPLCHATMSLRYVIYSYRGRLGSDWAL